MHEKGTVSGVFGAALRGLCVVSHKSVKNGREVVDGE